MSNATNEMGSVSVRIPLKSNQILNAFALENVQLVSFVKHFKQVQPFVFYSLFAVRVQNAIFSNHR